MSPCRAARPWPIRDVTIGDGSSRVASPAIRDPQRWAEPRRDLPCVSPLSFVLPGRLTRRDRPHVDRPGDVASFLVFLGLLAPTARVLCRSGSWLFTRAHPFALGPATRRGPSRRG